jgi:fructosamine-3-kinase
MQKINFLNEPKLSGQEHSKDQDERRLNLTKEIEKFLNNHSLFQEKAVNVYFFQEGVSSLVSKIELEEKVLILKIQIRPTGPKGEGLFLRTWEVNGISVPHIIEDGYIGEHYYILMENISAPFGEKDNIDDSFFFEMGKTLNKMHKVSAEGFGGLKDDGVAEYQDFKSWITEDKQINNQKKHMLENGILPENEYGYIEERMKYLVDNIDNNSSVYCHNDFSPNNIFLTKPLTVFDPVPSFNNPYIDLGRSILKIVNKGFDKKECIKSFLEGYFEDEKCKSELLQSSLLFNAYTMIPNLNKTGQIEKIGQIKKFLSETTFS